MAESLEKVLDFAGYILSCAIDCVGQGIKDTYYHFMGINHTHPKYPGFIDHCVRTYKEPEQTEELKIELKLK